MLKLRQSTKELARKKEGNKMKKLTLQETLELNKAQRREEFYRIKKATTELGV